MNYSTHELTQQIVRAINKKKAIDLKVLDVQTLTPLTRVFIIAVAANVRQTKAIADAVEETVETLVENIPVLPHADKIRRTESKYIIFLISII